MKIAALLVAALFISTSTFLSSAVQPARARSFHDCLVPPKTTSVRLTTDLSPPVQHWLSKKAGKIAAPSNPYNATDIMFPGRANWRYLFAWHRADIWLVAVEHGGIASNNSGWLLMAVPNHSDQVMLIGERKVFPRTLCSEAKALWGDWRDAEKFQR